jgi:hypothetical protein
MFFRDVLTRLQDGHKPIHNYLALNYHCRSRDSVIGIATGYGLDDRGVGIRVPVGSRIFSSPRCPDRLRSSPSLLSKEYQGSFPGGKAAGA